MKEKLIPAGQNPYRISANERAKLPAEFLKRNDLHPNIPILCDECGGAVALKPCKCIDCGKQWPIPLVYQYIEESTGDLVVSKNDYRVPIER